MPNSRRFTTRIRQVQVDETGYTKMGVCIIAASIDRSFGDGASQGRASTRIYRNWCALLGGGTAGDSLPVPVGRFYVTKEAGTGLETERRELRYARWSRPFGMICGQDGNKGLPNSPLTKAKPRNKASRDSQDVLTFAGGRSRSGQSVQHSWAVPGRAVKTFSVASKARRYLDLFFVCAETENDSGLHDD